MRAGGHPRWIAAWLLLAWLAQASAQEQPAAAASEDAAPPASAEPASPIAAPDDAGEESDLVARLAAIRTQLEQAQAERARRSGAVERSVAELAVVDRQIGARNRSLQQLASEIAESEQRLTRLEEQQLDLAEQMGGERVALAALLRSAYALGHLDSLKLVLAQDALSDTGRLLAYQAQLQRVRVARLERIEGLRSQLDRLRAEVEEARLALASQRDAEATQLAELQARRGERALILRRLRTELAAIDARIEDLDRDRGEIESLLEQLREVVGALPALAPDGRPFHSRQGSLRPPLDGRVALAYGQASAAGRASPGIRYAADRGSAVRAVGAGRVAFADWLRGYGLLLIIDHGDGYMSLYGHCESLLKSEGDAVEEGETVARVGDSGGREETGLYFELRHRGRALDPAGWWVRGGR